MMKRVFVALAAAVLVLSQHAAPAAATNGVAAETGSAVIADLNDLIRRINDKLVLAKTNDADLVENIREFDTLLARHKDAKLEERARILLMKGQLFLPQVLNRPDKALEVFKQFKRDFPTLQVNGNTDALINALERIIHTDKMQRILVPGTIFPGFEEKDLAGQPLSLAQFKGKVVLVDFWATWCTLCMVDFPGVLKLYEKYHDQGFDIVGINLDQDRERLESFIRENHVAWRQYYDGQFWDTKLAVRYGIDKLPTTYLLDRNGKIIASNLRGDDLDKAIADALRRK